VAFVLYQQSLPSRLLQGKVRAEREALARRLKLLLPASLALKLRSQHHGKALS
jgi:hypothetical protein